MNVIRYLPAALLLALSAGEAPAQPAELNATERALLGTWQCRHRVGTEMGTLTVQFKDDRTGTSSFRTDRGVVLFNRTWKFSVAEGRGEFTLKSSRGTDTFRWVVPGRQYKCVRSGHLYVK
jgi:hypothetical protein